MVLNSHRWKTHNSSQQGAKPLKTNDDVVLGHHHVNFNVCEDKKIAKMLLLFVSVLLVLVTNLMKILLFILMTILMFMMI